MGCEVLESDEPQHYVAPGEPDVVTGEAIKNFSLVMGMSTFYRDAPVVRVAYPVPDLNVLFDDYATHRHSDDNNALDGMLEVPIECTTRDIDSNARVAQYALPAADNMHCSSATDT